MLLAVLNKKNVDQHEIIYFEFPISLIERNDVVFTDASANTEPPPSFYSDPADLANLNWSEIDSLKWKSANDTLRHQRMAEVLVHSRLPLPEATRVVVWNNSIAQRIQGIVNQAGVPFPPITYNPIHYFTNFADPDPAQRRRSVVMGPRGIAFEYKKACQQSAMGINKIHDALFETTTDLLVGLRADFASLPQTAELIGLRSENGMHKETVDVHTMHVVNNLKDLAEFRSLSSADQEIVELAAFLHDIGKGPKARWANNGGLQKVDPDHAVRAMPMMVEILTQNVKRVEREAAEILLKLVCYHDLVGEVLGKDRDEQQIIDVAQSKRELDLLFALGRADATSLVEWWWDERRAAALYDRCWKAVRDRNEAQGT